MKKKDFENKNVLITGGVEGIGLECAKKFVSSGSNVIVTCKTKLSYEKFLKSNTLKGIQLERLDITNDISIDQLKKKIDKLDILINGARKRDNTSFFAEMSKKKYLYQCLQTN